MINKLKIISFIIAILYVGLGTLWVLTSSGTDAYYFEWPNIILITLPVTAISFGIRFGTENYLLPVIIAQTIMFLGVYFLAHFLLSKKKNKTPNK